MSSEKVSQLTTISQSDVDNNVLIYVVDVTGGTLSRSVSRANLYLAVANIWTAGQTYSPSTATAITINLPSGPTGSTNPFNAGISVIATTIVFATAAQTGDYTTSRIDQATLQGAVTGTITNATTLKIIGAPIASTNVTITNPYSFWVAAGISRFDEEIKLTSALNIPLLITPASGPVGAATESVGSLSVLASNVSFTSSAQTGDYVTNRIDKATLINPSTGTITNATSLKIIGAPVASTNVTITNAYALWVAAGITRIDGAALFNSTLSVGAATTLSPTTSVALTINLPSGPTGSSSTFNGAFTIVAGTIPFQTTNQTGDYNTGRIDQATLTTPTAATITNASTLTIIGAPIAGSNVTITNPYALWVKAGTTLLQATTVAGTLTMSSANIALGSNSITGNFTITGTVTSSYSAGNIMLSFVPGVAQDIQIEFNNNNIVSYIGLGQHTNDSTPDSLFFNISSSLTLISSTSLLTLNTAVKMTNLISTYNSISTAGIGVVPVFSSSVQSKTNAAPASMTYSPPSTAGMYRITGYVDITTATTISLTLKVTYTDPGGTSRTDVVVFTKENSATLLTALTAADRYHFSIPIAINNGGGTITLADNSGTYTTCAYYLNAVIEEMQ